MSIADVIVQDKYKVVYKRNIYSDDGAAEKICYNLDIEASILFYWQREASGISADDYGPIG